MSGGLIACAAVNAFVSGACLGLWGRERAAFARRRERARKAMGPRTPLEAHGIVLECEGVSAWVILQAVRLSSASAQKDEAPSGKRSAFAGLVTRAGLDEVLTVRGCVSARMRLALGGLAAGFATGLLFSEIMAALLAFVGLAWGVSCLPRALAREAQARRQAAERQLSQMIEVVVLGLHGGMSFDRALELYHRRFTGALARSLALAQGQWTHGLCERGEALRQVARSYDSALLQRFTEGVVRSLRFGTSMAESLNVLSIEARATRKAKLEEQVAKAPVKMLLPVGGLILPAMLILILGPIMLDLMSGF